MNKKTTFPSNLGSAFAVKLAVLAGVVLAMAGLWWAGGMGNTAPADQKRQPAPPEHPLSTSPRPLNPTLLPKMPDFSTFTANGQIFHGWQDVTQPAVILTVWASWCSTCIADLPSKINYIKDNPNVALIALNIDSNAEDHHKALKKWGEFPNPTPRIWWLADPSRTISMGQLQVANIPETFILDASRTILFKAIGAMKPTIGAAAEALYTAQNQ
jgi:thiol-disulfide isomerase/thioredoxin